MTFAANIVLYIAAAVVLLSAAARITVEVLQCMKRLHHYLLNVENYIEWPTYVFSIIFVIQFGTNCWCPTNWQWQLGAFGVFLAWINLILFLKRVPLLGIYVLMFNTILYTFLKFVVIAFLFVVAFCISFYMILYKAVVVSGSIFAYAQNELKQTALCPLLKLPLSLACSSVSLSSATHVQA